MFQHVKLLLFSPYNIEEEKSYEYKPDIQNCEAEDLLICSAYAVSLESKGLKYFVMSLNFYIKVKMEEEEKSKWCAFPCLNITKIKSIVWNGLNKLITLQ